MATIDARRGPFLNEDDDATGDGRTPDIAEQVERIRRGLPPIPKRDLLAQVQRVLKGLPPRASNDLLAQAERKTKESSAGSQPPRAVPTPDNEVSFSDLPPRAYPVDGSRGGSRLTTRPEMVAGATSKGWEIRGATATALKGATLSGLAEAITGDANDYKLLDFKRDPRTLRAGESVNVTPLLEKAAGRKEAAGLRMPTSLRVSDRGIQFIKSYERLRLKPYDDQTGKTITEWIKGATIGYGHLIEDQQDWAKLRSGITEAEAETLFASDVKTKGEDVVRRHITAQLSQQRFDALVALAFNIGDGSEGFGGSTVVKMINDPEYKSSLYKDLESAWKAWKESRGKVSQGLINRRQDEWELYSSGDYRRDH